MQYNIPNEQVFWRWEMSSEHLQEFAKINLVNLVIWQLAKIYAKSKRRLSPRIYHLGLVKLKIRPTYAQLLGPDLKRIYADRC